MQVAIRDGEQDLLTTCKRSLAHGPLLALRYILPYLPWYAERLRAALHSWLSELLEWLERAMYLTLPPLARPQEANMGKACTCQDADAGSGLLVHVCGLL